MNLLDAKAEEGTDYNDNFFHRNLPNQILLVELYTIILYIVKYLFSMCGDFLPWQLGVKW